MINRRTLLATMAGLAAGAGPVLARGVSPETVLHNWYGLILNLVRHTATYSPPVASRAFAYLGIAAYEAVASGKDHMISLAEQLNGLQPLPKRQKGSTYDEAAVLHGALALAAQQFFSNTGPTGQRAMAAVDEKSGREVTLGLSRKTARRSIAYGESIAKHILEWSMGDGGAHVENLGFPETYDVSKEPGHWVPTNTQGLQQKPLLPKWGENRTFAMPKGASCPLPPPPAYSEDKTSEFFKQAKEVYDTRNNLTPEQKSIARFWSDDPMLSTTPPGHWIQIALEIFDKNKVPVAKRVDVLARLGVAVADAFIGCWQVKFQYDLVRPVSYVRKLIDPKWDPLLITPPFPEYPSGHSTQSGAAAAVMTAAFGEHFAFEDRAHEKDGLGVRTYPDFWAAAQEAAMSRLYGGIHFRAAIERGLDQGRCIGAYAVALKTVKTS